ncbi:hypothetical protein [Paenibacillus lautus]|uniref:hypothetical protein n=1 Tax=Paenibacillus lautus TaxID=1401 RepID=UPI003D2A5208
MVRRGGSIGSTDIQVYPGPRTVCTGSSAHEVHNNRRSRFGSGSNSKGDITPGGRKQ